MPEVADEVADLRKRLARLEAIQAIERLKYRYWRACDSKDPNGFRDCFVKEGAEVDYGPGLGTFTDREPLVELYQALALRREEGRWMYHDVHHGVHPDIELIDDETATGSWTFGFMRVNLVDQVIERASLEYRDTYVIEAGVWKIQKSHVTPLTSLSMPIPDGARIGPGPKKAGTE
jgi:hypothetical protein